ncbi:unnamed protein product, partial [marine sediment metagenome]
KDLSDEININVDKIFIIVNRVNGKLDDRLKKYIEEKKLDLLGIINMDDDIYEVDISGKTIFDIPEDSLALKQVKKLIEKLKL